MCLLLEEHLPKVYIEGVDYLGRLPEDEKQRVLALAAPADDPKAALSIEAAAETDQDEQMGDKKDRVHS